MLFQKYRTTLDYKTADVVEFYREETGKEIDPDSLPKTELDNAEVVHTSKDAGWLGITLRLSNTKKLTVTSDNNTFELVNEVPLGYVMWNIGKNAPTGCIPFCRIIPGTNNVEPDTLKAIQIEGAEKVMMALGNGCNTLPKMEQFVKRHQNAPEWTWEYRKVQRIKEAIPVLKRLHWY